MIQGGLSTDDRGSVRFINTLDFSAIKRMYQVEGNDACDARYWHGHLKESKYVYCSRGSAIVCAIKMGRQLITGQPTLVEASGAGPIERYILSANQPRVLHIPPNMANGFRFLERDTILTFFSTATLEESAADDYRFSTPMRDEDPFSVQIR
jgi:dTDP-4-dehydrorhamnose 3,5-epimerase